MSWTRILGLVVVCIGARAFGAGVFDIGNKAPDWAVVTSDEAMPEGKGPTSPRLDQIRGVRARLERPQVLELRATAVGVGAAEDPPADATRLYVVHLGAAGQMRHVEILRAADGTYF